MEANDLFDDAKAHENSACLPRAVRVAAQVFALAAPLFCALFWNHVQKFEERIAGRATNARHGKTRGKRNSTRSIPTKKRLETPTKRRPIPLFSKTTSSISTPLLLIQSPKAISNSSPTTRSSTSRPSPRKTKTQSPRLRKLRSNQPQILLRPRPSKNQPRLNRRTTV